MHKLARVLVLVAAATTVVPSPVVAGGLLQSATRLAAAAGRDAAIPEAPRAGVRGSMTAQAQPSAPAESGMSRRKKILIVVAAAVAAGVAMYAIDRSVVDNTPSSRGTRQD